MRSVCTSRDLTGGGVEIKPPPVLLPAGCRLAQTPAGARVNPRLTGTPDFPPPTGGGVKHPPRLSRLLLVVEKNGKSVRKLVENDNETISVNFSLMSKLWPPGSTNGKIFKFFFAIVKHRLRKPPLSRELL